jgi:hypothetical protein
MTKLADDNLQEPLSDVSTGKIVKRLVITFAYKDGVAVVLRDRYVIPRSAVYYWLDCFDQLPIDEPTQDEEWLGRPPALTRSKYE